MATMVLPNHSSNLLQRRMSQAQYCPMDMSSFNINFRPDTSAAPMPALQHLHEQQQHQHQQSIVYNPPVLVPRQMYKEMPLPETQAWEMEASFPNPYSIGSLYNGPSFGSLGWPSGNNTIMPAAIQQHVSVRHDSYSSTDSEPLIKLEDQSPSISSHHFFDHNVNYAASPDTTTPMDSADESKPAVFSTDIDTLMRAIQAKTDAAAAASSPRRQETKPCKSSCSSSSPSSSTSRPKKRYHCDVPSCGKSFHQKTHLEIHTRAHTGVKPFLCKAPACGQRFSQLGNLKTHERRHTGERPYRCEICGKTFAQHGNVRAHKIVHTATKPFTCRLDECGKQFTQLGNLKSHQNKFHVETIRRLKQRFEGLGKGDVVQEWEKEMWEYFGGLYKNCNKGIKGRGKDRRISGGMVGDSAASAGGLGSRRDSFVGASAGQQLLEGRRG